MCEKNIQILLIFFPFALQQTVKEVDTMIALARGLKRGEILEECSRIVFIYAVWGM